MKKVSNVLENKEIMDELLQAEMDQVSNYINIKYSILAVQDLFEKVKKRTHENIHVKDKVLLFIKKYTTFQNRDWALNEENLQRILNELYDSQKLINIKEIEERRLERLLTKAGIMAADGKSAFEIYEDALGVSKSGYKIIHRQWDTSKKLSKKQEMSPSKLSCRL